MSANEIKQDEIIRMAREAGCDNYGDCYEFIPETLERFTALVAANEREACAKVCDDLHHWAASCCAKDIRARGEK